MRNWCAVGAQFLRVVQPACRNPASEIFGVYGRDDFGINIAHDVMEVC